MSRALLVATLLVVATFANGNELATSHFLRHTTRGVKRVGGGVVPPLKKLPVAIRWDAGTVHTSSGMGSSESVWAMVDTLAGAAAAQDTVFDYPRLSYSELAVCASDPASTQYDFRRVAEDLIKRKNGLIAAEGTFNPQFNGTNAAAVSAQCRSEHVAAARLERIEDLTTDRERLMEHVAYRGPIFVGLDAIPLQTYVAGVLRCPTTATNVNTNMVVVGYDTSDRANGNGFWIVKAAWGVGWGENGYVRINMDNGACGIGSYGFAPHMMRLSGATTTTRRH